MMTLLEKMKYSFPRFGASLKGNTKLFSQYIASLILSATLYGDDDELSFYHTLFERLIINPLSGHLIKLFLELSILNIGDIMNDIHHQNRMSLK